MYNFCELHACALHNHIYLNSILASHVDRLSSGFNYTLLNELINMGLLHFTHVCTIHVTTMFVLLITEASSLGVLGVRRTPNVNLSPVCVYKYAI